MSIPSWANLAETFGPECNAISADVVNLLVPHYGAEWAGAFAERLSSIGSRLAAETATVTFGGHFSSGKSTVINALTGRSLLPTSDYPETGVPCYIRAGEADRAIAVTNIGTDDLSFSPEAIAREVSLIDADGDYRHTTGTIRRVEITLAGDVPPGGITLIDSPGINDSAAMTRRAAAAAASADILAWVINSRQALSETEQAFLADNLADSAGSRLVMVVNVFLPSDTAECWAWFLTERAPYIRRRLAETMGSDGDQGVPALAVMFMSARAAVTAPLDFGAPAVRKLVSGLDASSAQVRTARLTRAASELASLIQELDTRVRQERARQERARAARKDQREKERWRRAQFERAIGRDVAAAFLSHQTDLQAAVDSVVVETSTGPLQRDGGHGRDLRDRLGAITDQIAGQVLADASRIAHQYEMSTPSAETVRQLRDLLTPASIEIAIPNNPIVKTSRGGVGAVVGGFLGTLLAPGAGTAVGAALGGALGKAVGDDGVADSVLKDRAGAQANARSAGTAALSLLAEKQTAASSLVSSNCRSVRPSHSAAGSSIDLRTLTALRDRLEGQGGAWLRRARSSFPQEPSYTAALPPASASGEA